MATRRAPVREDTAAVEPALERAMAQLDFRAVEAEG